MNFYIDFEATQPENEIIAVGAVAENGATFYSLVKPRISCMSNWISQMTHISQEELNQAKNIDEVFVEFDLWVTVQEPNIMKCNFIAYGNDETFIKATLPAIKDDHAFVTAAYLLAKIEDGSKKITKFFNGSISLINAFNYIQSLNNKQQHNPLEDANMLKTVYENIDNLEPLKRHPFGHDFPENKMPSGKFYCITGKKKREFATCDDAIDWLLNTYYPVERRAEVHRDRVAVRIMKAIKQNTKYMNYKWERVKEEKVTAETCG